MKKIVFALFMFTSIASYSQKFTLIEINADWNKKNSLPYTELAGVEIKFARLEEQPVSIQKSVKSVPTLVLLKDGRNVYQWQAGIDLKLKITEKEVKEAIKRNKL